MTNADLLRGLHRPGTPLVLANIWDAASAKLVEAAGFAAVATSSAAVAEALGHADGQAAPAAEMLAAAARIARAVALPVTVDAEAGYGLPADELVTRLLAAGAVGCNLEDTAHETHGLRDPAEQAAYLAAVRAAAGDALVVNARVDVFVRAPQGADEHALLPAAIERARAYLDAGADCVYPILVRDPAVVEEFTAAVAPAPVNVLVRPGGPAVADLAAAGVARVSMGPGLWRAALADLRARLADIAAN
jgi:2-methylisocitrate lyase-like PEP mutase family enzyme